MEISVIRENDDPIADARISIVKPKNINGLYFVFRGHPDTVLEVLEQALDVARQTLPIGQYNDDRGAKLI